METRRLANFIAVVDCGSVTRAAERMHIAQPALSQQVATLEAELGRKLLLRSRQGVATTAAGRALYVAAQSLLRQVKQLEADVQSAGDIVSGHVSVGLPVSCAGAFSMPLLKAVRSRYPRILLRISENLSGLLGELILNNRLDIALLYATAGSEGLARRPLLVERMCLVCQSELAPARPVGSPVEVVRLADTPLVLPSHSNGLRALVDSAFAKHGLKPRIVAELDSLPSLQAAAVQGVAATILPRSAVGPLSQGLGTWEIVDPPIERTIVLCQSNSNTRSPPVEALAALIVETIDDLVASGSWKGVSRI